MFSYFVTLKRFLLFFYSLLEAWFLLEFVYTKYSREVVDKKIANWAARFIARMGITIRLNNFGTKINGLVISNHVSWFDAVALRRLFPARYIAKEEVRSYPIVGRIGEKVNVVFISRENKAESPERVRQVVDILKAGENITFFPEGTSTEGVSILPFKVTFFEAAILANVPVIPVVIRYLSTDGSINTDMGFPVGGVGLLGSAWKVSKQRGVVLEVNVLDQIDPNNLNRIELAHKAHAQMVERFEQLNQNQATAS